ncbi:MAG: T9SS type A sorting domain-containing protein [Flavobacteriaceae bacterium]|nr:T9SS type A sorting domain-containing protein [Flavobacteriaceae bacterium]
MKNIITLFIALLVFHFGYGQIITFDFGGNIGDEVSVVSNFNDANLTTSTIIRGAGLTANNNANRFNARSWSLIDMATAVAENSYMEFSVVPNSGFQFDITTIDINFQRSLTGTSAIALRSSIDGYGSNIDGEKAIVDNTNIQTFSFNVSQANSTTAVTYRFYGYSEQTGGSGGFEGGGNDIIINGSVFCTDTLDYNNLQFPATGIITAGGTFPVYAQAYEPGVTDSSGQGANVEAWIGYSLTDTNPNGSGWTWIAATYNGDVGNNDEYVADIGVGIAASGTYYYASRFRFNSCGFTYGGYNSGGGDGFWDGTNDINGILTVNADQVDFCNVDFPKTANRNVGDIFNVYAQAHEPGVTDSAGQGANILAWIGYNTIGINHQPWDTTGWNWVAATYDSDAGNNDQYVAEIGSALPAGTYYYASRFQLNGSDYSYGGIQADNVGNFWDTTNNSGTLNISCSASTTWAAGTWNNGIPNINTNAIINDNYNTTTNGSFTTCSLTINAGFTLRIDNGDYVEIQTNIVADGNITVETQGAVVQIDDDTTVTGAGSITVIKTTAPLNAWYEYTYWSSPVTGETIGTALSDADPDRRFWFNASNFQDTTMETGNNNATAPGQDDIDDNGDDWQLAAGTDIMTPGVGYAATHSEVAFIGPPFSFPPYQFDYNFFGLFNNGVITVPVVRNDVETADTNWNLIGNPYPSAIDVDAFFNTNVFTLNTNGLLDGTIYLWSQNTPPDENTNGNEGQNFAQSDYATINGTGENAGGDGLTPNRFIPSGQGFFVSVADAPQPLTSGNVIFNNSMRVIGNNDQFFRASNSNLDNKLWLNLTSDNGVFNQALVGYVNGATNSYDGTYYDAPRNLSTGASSILYTTIEGNTKKFAIQGKDVNSLCNDEVISVGFSTTIDVATLYTLSIAQFEGDFFSNNTVYLKDNLLNILHDLSLNDYAFTSEVGEFNERFEIVFNENALSLGEHIINSDSLSIIELNNGNVQFKLSSSLELKSIEIIDFLGRTLYRLEANGNSKTYNLSNLSQATYIAKVELSNGVVITKKAIKRN